MAGGDTMGEDSESAVRVGAAAPGEEGSRQRQAGHDPRDPVHAWHRQSPELIKPQPGEPGANRPPASGHHHGRDRSLEHQHADDGAATPADAHESAHRERCAVAHGVAAPPVRGRRLLAVFASPVAFELAHIAAHVGYEVLIFEPDTDRPSALGMVSRLDQAGVDEVTDVVVTDHDRPELGEVLASILTGHPRWVGVMGSPRVAAPHVAALRDRGFTEEQIARVHRPIGLDIGSRSPAEIAVSTVAGLLADRAGRSGGPYQQVSALEAP